MTEDPSRRFPNFAWSWPEGRRLLLLHAALNPDNATARQALADWFAQNDLADATFPEHRLLAAITTRFGRSLEGMAEYPRLIGLHRLHWTQSRLAVAANLPPLQAFVDAGLKVVLLKGAARIALDPSEQKSRTAFDLDLLLPDRDFETAVGILTSQGWQSTRGESALGLRARVSSVRARNFKMGRFGDIDLHRCAYQYVHASEHDDAQLLIDAQPATYYDVPVFVPTVEERLVMAMGHGAWDGHHHSDWLVDIASMLEREVVDWDKLRKIAVGRHLGGPVAIALSFLSQELNLPIQHDDLKRFGAHKPRARIRDIPALILARDTETLGGLQRRMRGVVHQMYRLRRSGRDKSHDTKLVRARTRATALPDGGPKTYSHVAEQSASSSAGRWALTAKLLIKTPAVRRRIELELNAPDRNLCHIQALHLHKRAGTQLISFSTQIDLTEADFPVTLASLPSKYVEAGPDAPERLKYDKLPFTVLSLALVKTG
ncbi:MAG: nucleotidyltransferase family protein [Octadecabacter sp.]